MTEPVILLSSSDEEENTKPPPKKRKIELPKPQVSLTLVPNNKKKKNSVEVVTIDSDDESRPERGVAKNNNKIDLITLSDDEDKTLRSTSLPKLKGLHVNPVISSLLGASVSKSISITKVLKNGPQNGHKDKTDVVSIIDIDSDEEISSKNNSSVANRLSKNNNGEINSEISKKQTKLMEVTIESDSDDQTVSESGSKELSGESKTPSENLNGEVRGEVITQKHTKSVEELTIASDSEDKTCSEELKSSLKESLKDVNEEVSTEQQSKLIELPIAPPIAHDVKDKTLDKTATIEDSVKSLDGSKESSSNLNDDINTEQKQSLANELIIASDSKTEKCSEEGSIQDEETEEETLKETIKETKSDQQAKPTRELSKEMTSDTNNEDKTLSETVSKELSVLVQEPNNTNKEINTEQQSKSIEEVTIESDSEDEKNMSKEGSNTVESLLVSTGVEKNTKEKTEMLQTSVEAYLSGSKDKASSEDCLDTTEESTKNIDEKSADQESKASPELEKTLEKNNDTNQEPCKEPISNISDLDPTDNDEATAEDDLMEVTSEVAIHSTEEAIFNIEKHSQLIVDVSNDLVPKIFVDKFIANSCRKKHSKVTKNHSKVAKSNKNNIGEDKGSKGLDSTDDSENNTDNPDNSNDAKYHPANTTIIESINCDEPAENVILNSDENSIVIDDSDEETEKENHCEDVDMEPFPVNVEKSSASDVAGPSQPSKGDTVEAKIAFRKFLKTVEEKIVDSSFEEVLPKKVAIIQKYFKRCGTYVNEKAFALILNESSESIRKAPNSSAANTAVLAFHKIFEHLKSHVCESAIEIEEDHLPKVKKLEKTIKLLRKRIKQLEEAEVNFDDDEDSAYIMLDRYQARLKKVYTKYCQYIRRNPYSGRPIYDKISFVSSKYNEINQAISRKYKNAVSFPTYYELEKYIEKTVKKEKLDLSDFEIKHESKKCFQQLGSILQKKRRQELYDSHLDFIESSEDPATKDISLENILRKNYSEGKEKIDKLYQKYVDKQEQGEDHVSSDAESSEGSDSDEDSEKKKNKNSKKKGHKKGGSSSPKKKSKGSKSKQVDVIDKIANETEGGNSKKESVSSSDIKGLESAKTSSET